MKALLSLLLAAACAQAGSSIKITGNTAMKSHKIKDVIALEPEAYNKDGILSWQEDMQFYVSDLYRKSGYFDAKVDVDVHPHPGGDGNKDLDAVIAIQEGVRYAFDSVRVVVVQDTVGSMQERARKDTAVVGVDSAGKDTIKLAPPQQAPQTALVADTNDLAAKRGKPYLEDVIFEDRRSLLQRYGNSGYVRAKVDDKVAVKADTKTVRVDYLVEPSYPVLFDTLIIRNQRAAPADTLEGITRDRILRSLVKYKQGDTVRISGTDRLIEKLQYTGAYNFARLKDSLLPGPEHRSALIMQLQERIPGNFRSSVFYETYTGPGVSFDARHSNFAGTLDEIRGGTSLATLRQNFYAGFGSPLTFGYLIRFDYDFSLNWYQDQPLNTESGGADQGLFGGDFDALNSARLTWPWSYWLRLVGDAELESKSRMLTLDSRERSLNLNFIQTAFFAFLNQSLDPSRGFRFAPSWGNGGPFIEDGKFRFTEFRHNWLEMQSGYYYYYPGLKPVKFALRLDGGQFFGQGGTNSDRFFLGGGRSVRSYGFRALCPETENAATSKKGDSVSVCSTQNQTLAYFLSSYEVRVAPFAFGYVSTRGPFKSLIPLELVPFYDFGKVWNSDKGFALSGPGHQGHGQGVAEGLGFRYPLLGIFNLRIDLAYGRHRDSYWPDAWIVDLAQAF
jgi:outer membrane protein assembly factor BamA